MTERRQNWSDTVRIRWAVSKERRKSSRSRFQTKRSATLLLGAALSMGGVAEAVDGVSYTVDRNLDRVQVVRQKGEKSKVVANIQDGFTANSVFKIARILPDNLVNQTSNLFDGTWLGGDEKSTEAGSSLVSNIRLINDSIREQFFKTQIPFGDLIQKHSARYDVDPALVAAVIEQESRFKVRAISPVGARGLMQLMPRTGRWMGANDLYDADQNVAAGVKYLKYLDKRFDGTLTLTIAAYNAGEGTVKRYGGVPPYRETRQYVQKVMANYEKRNRQLVTFEKTLGSEPVAR